MNLFLQLIPMSMNKLVQYGANQIALEIAFTIVHFPIHILHVTMLHFIWQFVLLSNILNNTIVDYLLHLFTKAHQLIKETFTLINDSRIFNVLKLLFLCGVTTFYRCIWHGTIVSSI
jgi:hypothetical protein